MKIIEEKSEYDIRMMRQTALIADEAMEATLDACKEGVPEYEPALVAHSIIAARGGEYGPATLRTHGPYMASSSNILSSCRSYFFTGRKLTKGDMFLVDMGICYNGYYNDMCRTVCIGKPNKRQKEMFNCVLSMHDAMFRALKPGVTGGEIWEKMLHIARERNLFEGTNKRAWSGHGIGIKLPEPPFIAKGEARTIKTRTFMNIEPGVHFPGVNAAIEDTTLVTESGAEFVTKCKRDLHIA
jgi:Xaa-Pro aminopeptidase